ncbi:MAG: LytR/AlgR family response regulator transcription factor [Mucilaginibacter sp.]|uniref:LytR/AlgR family response regulator transcription factor n=1 Tax=Mucilaginibacter sp. L3T2-6 TaxID=3062491 RepID=UPI0026758A49|nr:response regulator transcription factor [Mucilaginibacter sp. L3T2-6]MDO3642103.1 response regulator transcription factor [Mucilaginibacter sp. L3T2-6]MDV6214597.1 response regulator transcription factor [Mucilaginibacter sp. L3T2-6]
MLSRVKILIVEDNIIIAEQLRMMLEGLGYEVPGMFSSGLDAVRNFTPGYADIVIMDIELADNTNGIDTAIELKKISDPPIIFITNNTDERIRKKAIYETNAIHYVTKPFTRTDISIAIDLTLKLAGEKETALKKENEQPSYLMNDSIFIKEGAGFKKIMTSDIRFLQADGSYCYLHVRDGKIMFTENLSFLEGKLAFAKNLVRVHRSYIVNINYITKIQDSRLWIDDEEIPVGVTYKKDLDNLLRFI